MNIAFLTKEYHQSTVDAGFTTIFNLAKEMKKQGHTVIMISGRQKYTEHKDLIPAGNRFDLAESIPIYRPYYFPWFKTKHWFLDLTLLFNRVLAAPLGLRYVEKKRNIKFDIIHSFSSSPILAVNGILAGLFSKKAKIIHSIKSFSEVDKYSFTWMGPVSLRILNFCNAVLVPLKYIKQQLVLKGCRADKIQVIHSPLRLNLFNNKDKNKLRSRYKSDKKTRIILYYGNRVASKGADVLIEAAKYLPEKDNFLILMCFPTEINKNDIQRVKEIRNGNKIRLLAGKIDVVHYLNLADIIVLPYRNFKSTEANPLCLLEAMACKTPIVTTGISELKELVQNYRDVLMAPPDNPKSLADKIMELLNNAKLQKKLIKNAYVTVQKFDAKIIARQHLELYTRLLNKSI